MRPIAGAALASALLVASVAPAQTLRIGLREDPDVLDPTLARTYVGRIARPKIRDAQTGWTWSMSTKSRAAARHARIS